MKTEHKILLTFLVFQCHTVVSDKDDPFDGFDFDLNDFEDESKLAGQLEDGFKNWEERCLKIGGEEVLKAWQKEQENLILCFIEKFDMDMIEQEIEEKKKSGDLDDVFKKYCGEPVQKLRSCLESFLSISHQCLYEEDRAGLNITLQMVDAAINFTCHQSGDRIALFMSESGMDCVEKHQDKIVNCLNRSIPEIFQTDAQTSSRIHFYVFQQENCRKGDAIINCVEESLMQCDDPTPSNLVHGLLRSMKEQTPCARAATSWQSGALSPLLIVLVVIVTLETFVFD